MQPLLIVDRVGAGVLGGVQFVGALATFGGRAVRESLRPPYEFREILRHLFQFGYRSAPLPLDSPPPSPPLILPPTRSFPEA